VGGAGRFEALPGIRLALNRGINQSANPASTFRVYRQQDLLLGAEVVINRAGQHVDSFGNIAHRGRVKASLAKKPCRRVQQLDTAVILASRPADALNLTRHGFPL